MNAIRRRPLVSREFLSAYISGYADGEGCFTVSIAPRATLAVGWEVRPSFSVSQNGDRAEVLQLIEATFGCGNIRPDRSDRTLKWETRRLEDLLDRVIPHFERYPLRSSKQKDFESFRTVVQLMLRGGHLEEAGFREIVRLAAVINTKSKKRFNRSAITPEMNA